jgi:hypothetical protein
MDSTATASSTVSSRMPEEHRMEAMSVAYVRAIAAKAGANIVTYEKDYGFDIGFRKVREDDHRYSHRGSMPVDCQLKSAKKCVIKDGMIAYKLKKDNYNDIINTPFSFLVLLCLPESIEEWIRQSEECLSIYRCSYYWKPGNLEETSNDSTKTVYIPTTQQFTEEVLLQFMDEVQSKLKLR